VPTSTTSGAVLPNVAATSSSKPGSTDVRAIARGSSAIAGDMMTPTSTCPDRPALRATRSSCASARLVSAMRAWRIMVSP